MSESALDIKTLKGLTQDSRSVKSGYLFAAIPGSKSDGRKYIADAVRYGASAVLAPKGTELPEGRDFKGIRLITDENPRRLFALMAAEFYERQPEDIVAVTGTNGKTSTVHFVQQLWKSANLKAASLGTLGVRAPGMIRSASMTTPDPVSLHAGLADLAGAGVTHLAMEASSHGLHQYRLDGVRVSAAGFTNLSRDHLDYHHNMDEYLTAKTRLFAEVMQPGGTAVLNADTDEYAALEACALTQGHRVLSYGHKGTDLKILSCKPTPHGQDIKAEIMGHAYSFNLPLVGAFQVMNALCALGLVMAEDPDNETFYEPFIKALSGLKGAPGRLQLVPGHPKGAVYVDYAHTPDALETVLTALRPHTKGKLICVFGCGGDRDEGKRPMMGKISTDLADLSIVTDDNPRSEDPAAIRKAILEAAPGAEEIGGRREAIKQAVAALKGGDVLVIAGKGHEQGQIFEDRTEPFDDFEEAEKAIQETGTP